MLHRSTRPHRRREALLGLGVVAERIYVDHGLTGTNCERPGLREGAGGLPGRGHPVATEHGRLARSLPDRSEAPTEAKQQMFPRTDTGRAPWCSARGDDKKRARVGALRLFLSLVDYEGKDRQVVLRSDPKIVQRGRDAVGD